MKIARYLSNSVFEHQKRWQKMRFIVTTSDSRLTEASPVKKRYESDPQMLARWLDVSIVKRQGRAFDADNVLISRNEAIKFPSVKGFNLNGTEITVPNSSETGVRLVCFSIKHYGFTMVRSWCDPFVQHFNIKNSIINDNKVIKCTEICFVEYGFLSMAKNVFARNLKSSILESQHDNTLLAFGGLNVRTYSLYLNFIDNIFV